MIQRYFVPLSRDGLKDDAAVLEIPDGYELVVSSDTLNEGVHFLDGTDAGDIAHKALRVNLSDLASTGAKPLCYQLNIAFPEKPTEGWLQDFSDALAKDNQRYGVFCSGGDTTSIQGKLSISITAMGLVPVGKAVKRTGAREGDVLIVTGKTGRAVLGLKAERDDLTYPKSRERYRVPEPRVGYDTFIQEHIHAAVDISDGLLADSKHIANASGLGVEIDLDAITFSQEVNNAICAGHITFEDVLKGGDDYELALAVSARNVDDVVAFFLASYLEPMVIGRFVSDYSGLRLLNAQSYDLDLSRLGWVHF